MSTTISSMSARPASLCSAALRPAPTIGRPTSWPKSRAWATVPTLLRLALSAAVFVRRAALATLPYRSLTRLARSNASGYRAAMRPLSATASDIPSRGDFRRRSWKFFVGQNGFLSAALFGGTLGFLERRRRSLAGVLLGLLSYKPHSACCFRSCLSPTGDGCRSRRRHCCVRSWRPLMACVRQRELARVLRQLEPITSRSCLAKAARLEPAAKRFGLVRRPWRQRDTGVDRASCGERRRGGWLSPGLAQSRQLFELKAAALAAGALLVTPYVYIYDLVVLAVAAGFPAPALRSRAGLFAQRIRRHSPQPAC